MLLFSIALLPLYIYFVLFYFSVTSCMFTYLKYLESLHFTRKFIIYEILMVFTITCIEGT